MVHNWNKPTLQQENNNNVIDQVMPILSFKKGRKAYISLTVKNIKLGYILRKKGRFTTDQST